MVVGFLGKEGVIIVFFWSCEGGLRVFSWEVLGIEVDSSYVAVEGEDVGSVGVGEGKRVVLIFVGGFGVSEGGLCFGERVGRFVFGSSNSIFGGCCRGCRMADGVSTVFGKVETEV